MRGFVACDYAQNRYQGANPLWLLRRDHPLQADTGKYGAKSVLTS